jgi:SAM-dependent methyltransferase/uncharacterized protein YbaR (Trm112 family)
MSWPADVLVCPRDKARLEQSGGDRLVCTLGHVYPVVDGVPVMLIDDADQTIGVAHESLRLAREPRPLGDLYVETLGISEDEQREVLRLAVAGESPIDPAVLLLVGATNGLAYRHLIGELEQYPVPELRLPPGEGRTLLDIGCNWGRWSIAAAKLGYRTIGVDPSLGAVMAARRIAGRLGLDMKHVVGDARYLPFADQTIDVAFSYSVLQHFSRADAGTAIAEAGRVLRPGGASLIQMPTVWGLRCLYHQARRRFRQAAGFEVRYWTIGALQRVFTAHIGPSRASVDCFFGIGLQGTDRHLMPATARMAISASEALRAASRFLPPLSYVADSVYVSSVKPMETEPS